MTPLTTLQGMTPQALQTAVNGRSIMIWGTGDLAQDVETSLIKSGLSIVGHLHSKDENLQKKLAEKPFVILATATWRKQAEDILSQAGLQHEIDFISHLSIRRPQAIVEITNARAPSPLHLDPPPAPSFMSLDNFTRIIEKLNRDIPQLVRIGLSYFGDPRLHPDCDAMVTIAKKVAPVSLTFHGIESDPYIMPYDALLKDQAPRSAIDALPYNLSAALDLCKQDTHLPCLSQRVFPIIQTDGSVAVCHLYNPLILDNNYLDADWARLLQHRSVNALCEACQACGLHRLDLDVLRRRHGKDCVNR